MQVACMKAIKNAGGGCKRRGDLASVFPVAGKRPLVQLRVGRGLIDMSVVPIQSASPRKVLRSFVARMFQGILPRPHRVVPGCP
jgi:hypothetical protein